MRESRTVLQAIIAEAFSLIRREKHPEKMVTGRRERRTCRRREIAIPMLQSYRQQVTFLHQVRGRIHRVVEAPGFSPAKPGTRRNSVLALAMVEAPGFSPAKQRTSYGAL
jgi:hypothetical protein